MANSHIAHNCHIFNNTIFQPNGEGAGGLGGSSKLIKHCVTRNNILHVLSPEGHSLSNNKANIDNDYDYDLFNGQIPPDHEAHGIRGEPIYAPGAGLDPKTRSGHFQLAPDSPGAGAGEPIPNFSNGYTGKSPDMGAHQRGAPPTRYGVEAGQQ